MKSALSSYPMSRLPWAVVHTLCRSKAPVNPSTSSVCWAVSFTPALDGVTTVAVRGGPCRAEHVVWSRRGLSPAASAFLALLSVEA